MDKDETTTEFDALGSELDAEFGDTTDNSAPTEDAGAGVDEPDEKQTQEEESSTEPPKDTATEDTSAESDAPAPTTEEPKAKEETGHDVDDDPQAQLSSKEALKEALRELDQERQTVDTTRKTLREEIKQRYYPEGIQIEPLLDSENKPITGVADVAGKLINPRTNDVFTWEEAKDWYDSAIQEQKDRISSIEQDIDAYAEKNQTLLDGTNRVMDKYGELLKSMPEVAQQALEGFQGLMKVDPKTGVITDAPDPVRYYDLVMRPYVEVAKQKEAEAQLKAEQEAQEQRKRSASDRADLPIGSDGSHPGEKDLLDKAFDEYFKG